MAESSERNGTAVLHPPFQEGVFLHSMLNFRSLLDPLLAIRPAPSICEIGVEGGLTTTWLGGIARSGGGSYLGIDPAPRPAAVEVLAAEQLEWRAETSHAYLEHHSGHDIYFIDGDHNYHTVEKEVEFILQAAARRGAERPGPILLFHDVSWPCARRDTYYAPDRIPAEARRPHSFEKGASVFSSSLVDGGFAPEGQFAYALEEGGEKNGVLTAVEDVLARHTGWKLLIVPAIFGLGIAYRPESVLPGERAVIDRLETGLSCFTTFLGQLEFNRIHAFEELVKVWGERDALVGQCAELQAILGQQKPLMASLEDRIQEMGGQKAKLKERLAVAKSDARELSGLKKKMKEIRKHCTQAGLIRRLFPTWYRKLHELCR